MGYGSLVSWLKYGFGIKLDQIFALSELQELGASLQSYVSSAMIPYVSCNLLAPASCASGTEWKKMAREASNADACLEAASPFMLSASLMRRRLFQRIGDEEGGIQTVSSLR